MRRLVVTALAAVFASTVIPNLYAQTNFTTSVITAHPLAEEIVSADFNGDKRPDLLVGGQDTAGGAAVYLNDSTAANGPFAAPMGIPGTQGVAYLAAVDLNGDGKMDFVGCYTQVQYSTLTGPFKVFSFINDGTGHFTEIQSAPQTGICRGLVVGDVNRDGHPDVVTIADIPSPAMSQPGVPPPPQNFVVTWFNDGTGALGAPVVESNVKLDSNDSRNCDINSVAGGDFFSDGNFSLLIHTLCYTDYGSSQPSSTTFTARSQADGKYSFTYAGESAESLVAHAVVDADGDGKPDVITTGTVQPNNASQHLYIEHNDGNGQFTLQNITPSVPVGQTLQGFGGITLGDFNGDGHPDLAVDYRTATPQLAYTSYVTILSGGNGTFTPSQTWIAGGVSSGFSGLTATDFNVDSRTDLVAINSESTANQYNLYLYANAPGQNSCNVPSTVNTGSICTPSNGSSVSSPVAITAATNTYQFTLNRLYLDNNSVFQVSQQSINTALQMSPGKHTLALVSYSQDGSSTNTTTTTFTVGNGSGCLPSSAGVQICAPTPGSSPSSPVTVQAGAVAAAGNITAIRTYVDDQAVDTVNAPSSSTSFSINRQIPMLAGSHRVVIVAYESTGQALSKEVDITVVGSPANCYPSSAGAMICSPAFNATVGTQFSVTGGATASNGFITALRVYIDNADAGIVYNPNQSKSFGASQTINATTGSHYMVVVGYQSDGRAQTASEQINVK